MRFLASRPWRPRQLVEDLLRADGLLGTTAARVEHPKVKGIIWISEPHSLWSGVLEHELLHGAAGFGYHSRVDAARNGDGAHVPGACTDDHSVLQGPVWDWVEGAPYAGAPGGVDVA